MNIVGISLVPLVLTRSAAEVVGLSIIPPSACKEANTFLFSVSLCICVLDAAGWRVLTCFGCDFPCERWQSSLMYLTHSASIVSHVSRRS